MPESAPSTAPTPRVKRTPRPKWLGWVILLAVLVIGYFTYQHFSPKPKSAMITAPVTRGDLVETVTASGSIAAQTGAEVHIGSQITGVVKKLYADVGNSVKSGAVIAELDLPDLVDTLRNSQAALLAAETKSQQARTTLAQTTSEVMSQVSQAKATVESMRQKYYFARSTASQSKETVPQDVVRAENTLNSSIAALNTAKATLTQTQAGAALNVSVAQATLNQAKANASKTDADLVRNQNLYNQSVLSASDLDTAIAAAKVNTAAVDSAQQNVALTQQKVDADLETAKDGVAQADQTVQASRASLQSALSEHHAVAAQVANTADANAALAESEAALAVAQANVENITLRKQDLAQAMDAENQSRQLVSYNQAQVDKSIIKTPITGTVLNLSVQQGETLAAGLAAPTVIIVADLDRLEVDAYVDETDIGKIKLGQPVQVSVDAFPQKTFPGKVFKIASGSTIQQGVVTYDVSIKLENQGHLLKPDMTATATFQIGSQTNVLLVPSVAVQVGVKSSKVNVLKMVNGQETSVPTTVKTGGTDGHNTQIISGVNVGDTIIVAGAPATNRRGPSNPFTSGGGGKKAGGG